MNGFCVNQMGNRAFESAIELILESHNIPYTTLEYCNKATRVI